jgi:hypothetical protein
MVWTSVLAQDALPIGKREVVKVGEQKVLILNHEGKIYALENACPHLKLPMKKGKITANGAITCPWHRSSFNLCSGAVEEWITWPPVVSDAMKLVSPEKALKVFPTRLEDGNILIDIES